MNRKHIAAAAGVLLLGTLLLAGAFLPAGAQRNRKPETAFHPDEIIRLHVVANSDSANDQALKRKVRDAIIRQLAPAFEKAGDIDGARGIARANLARIKEIASLEIKEEGLDYPVRAELNSFAFPTKHYGPFVLPAGDYEAVRVVIGAGGGANWWCVLFPPLCFIDMTNTAPLIQPENSSAASDIPAPGAPMEMEQLQGSATPRLTALVTGEDQTAAEDAAVRVEFRFRILDFLHGFFS